jgi:hypothetical protein
VDRDRPGVRLLEAMARAARDRAAQAQAIQEVVARARGALAVGDMVMVTADTGMAKVDTVMAVQPPATATAPVEPETAVETVLETGRVAVTASDNNGRAVA